MSNRFDNSGGTEAVVQQLPPCDICGKTAAYDARTTDGRWAYLCEPDYSKYGTGLGTGRGQRLFTEDID